MKKCFSKISLQLYDSGASQFRNKYKCVGVKPTRINGFENCLTPRLARLGCTLYDSSTVQEQKMDEESRKLEMESL